MESVGVGGVGAGYGIPYCNYIVVVGLVGGAVELVNTVYKGRWWGAGRLAVGTVAVGRHAPSAGVENFVGGMGRKPETTKYQKRVRNFLSDESEISDQACFRDQDQGLEPKWQLRFLNRVRS